MAQRKRSRAAQDGQGVMSFEPRHFTRDNKTGGRPAPTAEITNAKKAGDSAPHALAPGEDVLAVDTYNQTAKPGPSPTLCSSRAQGPLSNVPAVAMPGEPPGGEVSVFQQSSMKGRGTVGFDEGAKVSKPVKTQTDGQMVLKAEPPIGARALRLDDGGADPLAKAGAGPAGAANVAVAHEDPEAAAPAPAPASVAEDSPEKAASITASAAGTSRMSQRDGQNTLVLDGGAGPARRGAKAKGGPPAPAEPELPLTFPADGAQGRAGATAQDGPSAPPGDDAPLAFDAHNKPKEKSGTLCGGERGGGKNEINLPLAAIPIQDAREVEKQQEGVGVGREGDPGYTVDCASRHAIAFGTQQTPKGFTDKCPTVQVPSRSGGGQPHAVAVQEDKQNGVRETEKAGVIRQGPGHMPGGQYVAIQEDKQNGVKEYDKAGSLRADAPGHQPGGSLIAFRAQAGTRDLSADERRSPPLEVCNRVGVAAPAPAAAPGQSSAIDRQNYGVTRELVPTLTAPNRGGGHNNLPAVAQEPGPKPAAYGLSNQPTPKVGEGVMPTLDAKADRAGHRGGGMDVVAFHAHRGQDGVKLQERRTPPVTSSGQNAVGLPPGQEDSGPIAVTNDSRPVVDGKNSPPIKPGSGLGINSAPAVAIPEAGADVAQSVDAAHGGPSAGRYAERPGNLVTGGAVPLDVRNATRRTDKSRQNRQGLGVGKEGDPAGTLTDGQTPAVAAFVKEGRRSEGETWGDRPVSPTLNAWDNTGEGHATALAVEKGAAPDGDQGAKAGPPGPEAMPVEADDLEGGERGGAEAAPALVPQEPAPMMVRRLTPTECERLQGFPDGHTCLCGVRPDCPDRRVPPWVDLTRLSLGGCGHSACGCTCSDSRRYRALGNAVAVPCVRWIGERLMEAARE